MVRSKLLATFVGIAAGLAFSVGGQPMKHVITISAAVICDDADTKTQLTSYVDRELRELSGVEIKPVRGYFMLPVNAVSIMVGTQRVGYAISVTYLRQSGCPGESPDIPAFIASQLYITPGVSTEALRDTARRIVADFDTNVLIPSR
jgi:hypothetical protein